MVIGVVVPRLLLLTVVLTGNVERIVVVGISVVVRIVLLVLLAVAKSPPVLISTRGVVVGRTLFDIGVIISTGPSVVILPGRRVENRVVKNCGKKVVDGKLVVVRNVVVAGCDKGSTVLPLVETRVAVVGGSVVVGTFVVVVGGTVVVVVGGFVVVVLTVVVVVVGTAVVVVVVDCWVVVGTANVVDGTGSSKILFESVGVGKVVVTTLLCNSITVD